MFSRWKKGSLSVVDVKKQRIAKTCRKIRVHFIVFLGANDWINILALNVIGAQCHHVTVQPKV